MPGNRPAAPAEPRTVAAALARAANVIETNGWCQDRSSTWTPPCVWPTPGSCQVCAAGAIRVAAGHDPDRLRRPGPGVAGVRLLTHRHRPGRRWHRPGGPDRVLERRRRAHRHRGRRRAAPRSRGRSRLTPTHEKAVAERKPLMSNYLEEAAQQLRKAAEPAGTSMSVNDRHRARIRVADGFARLAAIERGLVPPDWLAEALRAATGQASDPIGR